MVTYITSKGKNPNYRVQISCPGHDIIIVTDMPEQVGFGVSSDWESLLPYKLSDILGQGIVALASQAAPKIGLQAQSQDLSFQSWLGTSPIELPLKLEFNAQKSAVDDVYLPISLLASLAMPINGRGNTLWAPGPAQGGNGNDYSVHVRLGRMMAWVDCIITSANPSFDIRLADDGYPISGEIDLTFRTAKVYGHADLLKALGI